MLPHSLPFRITSSFLPFPFWGLWFHCFASANTSFCGVPKPADEVMEFWGYQDMGAAAGVAPWVRLTQVRPPRGCLCETLLLSGDSKAQPRLTPPPSAPAQGYPKDPMPGLMPQEEFLPLGSLWWCASETAVLASTPACCRTPPQRKINEQRGTLSAIEYTRYKAVLLQAGEPPAALRCVLFNNAN